MFRNTIAIFTGKHLCWSLFLIKLQALLKRDSKETPTVFSCAYCEFLRTTILNYFKTIFKLF